MNEREHCPTCGKFIGIDMINHSCEHPRGMLGKKAPWNKKRIGSKLSDEHKRKISKSLRGRVCSEETRRKISKSNMGKKKSKEHCKNMSIAMKGRIPFQKGKTYEGLYGKERAKKIKEKIKLFTLGHIPWNKGKTYHLKHNKQFKKGQIPWNKGKKMKKQDPKEIRKRMKLAFKTMNKRPNIPEKKLLRIIEKLNLPYSYTGDGSFFIEQYNPDFVNNNGQKKVIEVFGDYWHNRPDYKKRDSRRFEAYSEFGFKTLVIWEHELKDINLVVDKLKRFDEYGLY